MKKNIRPNRTLSGIAMAMNTYCASGGENSMIQKNAITQWVCKLGMQMKNPWSVVLTYGEPIAGGSPTKFDLAQSEAWLKKNFAKLVDELSQKAYGGSYDKHKKRINAFGFFEYTAYNSRFHIHAIFDVPSCHDPAKTYDARFKRDINRLWHKYGQVKEASPVSADVEKGLTKEESLERLCCYIAKLRTKKTESGSYADALLIEGYTNNR